jgi:ABC-type glycerol-3-phosphate transport system substrate-binding protein
MRFELMSIASIFRSLLPLLFATLAFTSCDQGNPAAKGRVVVKYWEKWTGFEADAMRAVVDDFNSSQNGIFVDYSSVSQMDRKLMLATSGGVPPDVAGIYGRALPVYAENNALTPLDRFASEGGITADHYIDVFWKICSYRDHLWGLPTTPACLALIWNKKLFREAGLDPEQPPRSIAELEQFNEKLVKRRPDGRLASCGHLPSEPGWWNEIWGWWFGGELWDGSHTITANSRANVASFEWLESYPKRFGAQDLLAFGEGFGNFASPQNPFFTGRVAMVLQGPWIHTFIKNLAPADFEWGVAPFPSADPDRFKDVTLVETDTLVIPAGSKHPSEAFEFIKYVNSQQPMEKLCLGQRKFSPLHECSAEFFQSHPNPYIGKFLELAKSPNAHFIPQLTTWTIYSNDMKQAFGRVWSGAAGAREALDEVQRHEEQAFDHQAKRWERLGPKLTPEWSKR